MEDKKDVEPNESSKAESPEVPENKESQESKKPSGKEAYWMLGAIVLLVGVFMGSYYFFGSLNQFEHEGLTFTKEKFDQLPVFRHYYYYNSEGQVYQYNLYLRNDPRKNNVPFTGLAIDKGIELNKESKIYISLDPINNIVGCTQSAVGIHSLSSFLTDNQLNAQGATTDKEQAELNNVEHITCDNVPSRDVAIIIKSGDETKVTQDKRNCYTIEIANCEVLEGIEKFQVEALIDAKQRKEYEAGKFFLS